MCKSKDWSPRSANNGTGYRVVSQVFLRVGTVLLSTHVSYIIHLEMLETSMKLRFELPKATLINDEFSYYVYVTLSRIALQLLRFLYILGF